MPTHQPGPAAARPAQGSRSYAYVFPLTGVLLLLGACVEISSRRHFWFDELCTYYPATDPSFVHMLRAQTDLINSAPPVYNILIWLWAHACGGSELSLRLATSLAFAGAFVVLFRLLRRTFGTFPAGFATLAWFTGSTMIMLQNAEARSYGVFVLELTLAAAAFHALATAPRLTRKVGAANVAIHVVFILTHYLAIFYGAAFFAAALAHEFLSGRRQFRRAFVIPLGYLAILPWIPVYLHHAEFSHPHGWIQTPYFPHLLTGLNLGVPILGIIGLSLAAAWAVTSILAAPSNPAATPSASQSSPAAAIASPGANAATFPLLLLALALALVPVLMWIFSRVSTPIFNERYYFPAGLAWPIIVAAVAARLDLHAAALAHPWARQVPRLFLGLMVAVLAGYFINYAVGYTDPIASALVEPPASFTDPATHAVRSLADLPIVIESPYTYLPRYFYCRQPDRQVYLLDWASATDPQADRSAANGYQIAAALKRQYPAFTIEESAGFLASHTEFLVYPADGFRWFADRIFNNPAYQTTLLTTSNSQHFLYVRRVSAAP